MKTVFTTVVLISTMLIASIAWGETVYVSTMGDDDTGERGNPDKPFKTIQWGIKAAQHGDTVLVANGIYSDFGLRFASKIIEVRSEKGPESTFIDGENRGVSAFKFDGGEGRLSIVNGFTITGSSDAIWCQGNASPTIINNIIIGNSGRGIYCDVGSSLIKNNIIAQNDDGGIKCNGASEIDGNIIMNNTALNDAGISCGGGLSVVQIISNNTIIWNSAELGGGGIGVYSSPKIINNTICFNTTTGSGGAIYSSVGSTPTVLNTILWGNTSPEIELDRGTIYVTYSDVQGGWPGEGNINADPLFVDPGNGDYHLQAGSPCIDAGDPNSPNDPDGTRADIGAFYYDQSPIPTVLEKFSGNNQSGVIGTKLLEPLVVLVKDQHDNPMSGVQVNFAVTSGDGSVNPTQAITDSDGKASTELTLGQTAGLNQVTATVNGLSVIFNATGIEPPVATTLEKVSGDNQSGDVGSVLQNPLVVRVLDQNSEPMEGVTINFSPSEGASANPIQATTDENGQAQTVLTLGAQPGEYSVTVSVEGLDPVVFTATAIAIADDTPIIFNVYPNYGYVSGGTGIIIVGAGFQDGATVTIGGRLAQNVTNPEETAAWLTSDTIDITDEASEDVQLLITLDEGTGATTEIITFSTGEILLANIHFAPAPLTEILRIIIQTAINNTFGAGKITVNVNGSDTAARVTFTTVAIGADVRLSIEQQAGSDILFSELLTSSGLQIHTTTPEGTIGPKAVVVTNPDGELATYPKGFVYLPLTGDVSGDGTISALDAALILQYVIGLIDKFPATSPISQVGQKYIAGEISIDELDRMLQKWGYPSVFKLLGLENQLLQNYPNPFNPDTWIPFKLAQSVPVTISIYDTKGQLIRTLHIGNKGAGVYVTKDKAAYWDGMDTLGEKVSSGVFFYTLRAGDFRATRKMLIVK